jgi:hypothetical protein
VKCAISIFGVEESQARNQYEAGSKESAKLGKILNM